MEIKSGAVSPSGSITEGWDIIKNDYWIFFLMTLVAIVVAFVASMILGLISNAISIALSAAVGITTSGSSDAVRLGASIVPQLFSMVVSLGFNIIGGAITGALFCGIYSAISRKASTGVVDFGDMFSGFQKFTACLVVAAIVGVLHFIILVVLMLVGATVGVSFIGLGGLVGPDGKPDLAILSGLLGALAVFALIYLAFSLILSALTSFAYPLIGDRSLSGGEALSTSVKGGLANLGGMILLLLLLSLMAIVATMLCFFPLLFVAPIILAAIFAAYRSVFGQAQSPFQNTPPPPPTFGNQPGY
jgi:uncharacterized membrane protein